MAPACVSFLSAIKAVRVKIVHNTVARLTSLTSFRNDIRIANSYKGIKLDEEMLRYTHVQTHVRNSTKHKTHILLRISIPVPGACGCCERALNVLKGTDIDLLFVVCVVVQKLFMMPSNVPHAREFCVLCAAPILSNTSALSS